MVTRQKTRVVHIGGVPIGGGHPIVIQSMTNTDTRNVAATVAQIHALQEAGCEIARVAVPDMEAAAALKEIKRQITIPLVADIHFDYRLALESVAGGVDKLRINPGNIGDGLRLQKVAEAAKTAEIPIRVGVNGGSLEKEIMTKYGMSPEALAESALRNVSMLEKYGFNNIVVSVKASNVQLMLDAHKILAKRLSYPLHIGLTEAGTPYRGTIHSAVGIGALLAMGIGDTIRVSLAGDPVQEIRPAREILTALGLRGFGVTVIACPSCGRTNIDVGGLATEIEARLTHINKPITVAVMGCVVNGPGEAREADIGVAGGSGVGALFRKGEIVRKVFVDEIVDAIVDEVENLTNTNDE
ncbi:MAG: flavodoxin-dependent (E)-4-hydroxy-3-methylbut-2-enyl-diphosphate synthase [Defluviitaleaceae bacterium]|nr:flavodoxin-dependent (E)-4-hydroxy-3-methylbut-2-enyl-diphosphate synthase [Defluviitaleaceae bacterium]